VTNNSITAITVDHLSKTFKLPHEQQNSLKGRIINFYKRGYSEQKILKNISFTVEQGEFFGIVGRNGSGKSTLLKLLAGIYHPDHGDITINGKLTPFIELGVGFNPELSGRDNVFLNGALLGFSRKQMLEIYDDIVAFAEIEEFMDQKLKNYSSGMQVRLAFSIAIRAKSDILLLDEVLAVGDSAFQQKCFDYFHQIKESGTTVIFISHDMEAVKTFCTRAMYVKNGEIKQIGKPQDIADTYLIDNFETTDASDNEESTQRKIITSSSVPKLFIKGKQNQVIQAGDILDIVLEYTLATSTDVELRLAIAKEGISFAHINSRDIQLPETPGTHSARINIQTNNLLEGLHDVYWGVFDKKTDKQLAFYNKAISFFVKKNAPTKYGLMDIDGAWMIEG